MFTKYCKPRPSNQCQVQKHSAASAEKKQISLEACTPGAALRLFLILLKCPQLIGQRLLPIATVLTWSQSEIPCCQHQLAPAPRLQLLAKLIALVREIVVAPPDNRKVQNDDG